MAKKTRRSNAQGDESRKALLDATLHLAGERGYVGTTMAQITKVTGLPASSVYWHFTDKDGLLAEALEHGFRSWRDHASPWSVIDPELPRRQRIRDQLGLAVIAVDDEFDFWRMGLLLALETGPAVGSGPRERFLTIRAEATERLSSWWSDCLDADGEVTGRQTSLTLARLTLAVLDGLYVAGLSAPSDDLEPVLDLLAAGLDRAVDHVITAPDSRPAGRRTARTAPQEKSPTRDSRIRLLRAGAEVAAASGYDGASISRICKEAGLPASSLYWHFADKDALLAEVVEHSYGEWYDAQPAWTTPDPGATWEDELRRHLSVSLHSLVERPAFLRIGYLLLLLRRDDPPSGRAMFVDVRRRARQVTSAWFDAALTAVDGDTAMADPMAVLLMAFSDGLFFSNQLDEPTWDTGIFSDLLVQVVSGPVPALHS